nr:hypothetical protein [Tanacetum cinerariifolium]
KKKRKKIVIEQSGQSDGIEDDVDFEETKEEDEIPLTISDEKAVKEQANEEEAREEQHVDDQRGKGQAGDVQAKFMIPNLS